MQTIDHAPQSWYLLQDGADLFLDCNCNASAFGYSVLIKLTPEETAEYRTVGRTFLSWLAERVQDSGPHGDYQKRDVNRAHAAEVATAVREQSSPLPGRSEAFEPAAWLAVTRWYVPAENLLAYLTDPALRMKTPVADQTLWSITAAAGGSFQGTSRTQLWVRAPDGGLQPMSSASNALDGTVTDDGEITIVFTPDDPDQPQTTGYGHLRRVDGEWRMEMQMATGTQAIAIHWAYMTRWKGEGLPNAAPGEGALDGSLRWEAWSWLRETSWDATDQELFPDGARFTFSEVRNCYCWAEGATASGSTLRMVCSLTPGRSLYLLFSVGDAAAVARRGSVESAHKDYPMLWSQPAGGPLLGRATMSPR